MYDPRTRQRRQSGIMVQQGIEQGPVRVAGRGVHHQPGRLVDDQQVVIFVDQLQPYRLGCMGALTGDLGIDAHRIATAHTLPDPWHPVIERHLPVPYPLLKTAARILRHQLRQRLVQTLAFQMFRDADRQVDGLGHEKKGLGYTLTPARNL